MNQDLIAMPRIGDLAPEFRAVTTQGPINFPADFAGNWVILFSHPADFTPVCTSEFMTFAHMESQFADVNCKLVGLSIDGLYSHIAWMRTINEKIEYKGMLLLFLQPDRVVQPKNVWKPRKKARNVTTGSFTPKN